MSIRWSAVLALSVTAALAVSAGEGARKIAPGSVYATTGQKELKPLSTAMDGDGKYVEPYGADLDKLRGEAAGKATVFLVAGKDITAAIKASRGRLGERAVGPPDQLKPAGQPVWLVAYLGTSGSSPPAWKVEGIAVKDKLIRVSYRKGAAVTDDVHAYLVWAPLGKLEPGVYSLELYDAAAEGPTCVRRCKVSAE
jgi:hypothetical protein